MNGTEPWDANHLMDYVVSKMINVTWSFQCQYENQNRNKQTTNIQPPQKIKKISNQENAERRQDIWFLKCLIAAVNSQFRTTAQGN